MRAMFMCSLEFGVALCDIKIKNVWLLASHWLATLQSINQSQNLFTVVCKTNLYQLSNYK